MRSWKAFPARWPSSSRRRKSVACHNLDWRHPRTVMHTWSTRSWTGLHKPLRCGIRSPLPISGNITIKLGYANAKIYKKKEPEEDVAASDASIEVVTYGSSFISFQFSQKQNKDSRCMCSNRKSIPTHRAGAVHQMSWILTTGALFFYLFGIVAATSRLVTTLADMSMTAVASEVDHTNLSRLSVAVLMLPRLMLVPWVMMVLDTGSLVRHVSFVDCPGHAAWLHLVDSLSSRSWPHHVQPQTIWFVLC